MEIPGRPCRTATNYAILNTVGAHNAIELSTHSEIPVRYIRYESNLLCKTKIQLSEIEIFGETPSSIEFIGSHLEAFLL